jgi:hypothetical protein
MMGNWFSKIHGDGMTAYEPSDEIEDAFLPLFSATGNPVDMAVFTRYDSEGHLQCEVKAFFSPAAAQVATLLDARPCVQPRRDALILLAGDQRCWPVLFPEGEK